MSGGGGTDRIKLTGKTAPCVGVETSSLGLLPSPSNSTLERNLISSQVSTEITLDMREMVVRVKYMRIGGNAHARRIASPYFLMIVHHLGTDEWLA